MTKQLTWQEALWYCIDNPEKYVLTRHGRKRRITSNGIPQEFANEKWTCYDGSFSDIFQPFTIPEEEIPKYVDRFSRSVAEFNKQQEKKENPIQAFSAPVEIRIREIAREEARKEIDEAQFRVLPPYGDAQWPTGFIRAKRNDTE